jgi:hypothetical protein
VALEGKVTGTLELFMSAKGEASAPPIISVEDVIGRRPTRRSIPELDAEIREISTQ